MPRLVMGASYWSYVVPYDTDVERAFRALQADVFERRAFYSSEGGRAFASIGELLDAQAEEGTHSILDMKRVATTPAPPPPDPAEAGQRLMAALFGGDPGPSGTIFPLSEAEARERLGVERLTTEPEPSKLAMERGTGRYAVLFEGDLPTSLWFGGVSGA